MCCSRLSAARNARSGFRRPSPTVLGGLPSSVEPFPSPSENGSTATGRAASRPGGDSALRPARLLPPPGVPGGLRVLRLLADSGVSASCLPSLRCTHSAGAAEPVRAAAPHRDVVTSSGGQGERGGLEAVGSSAPGRWGGGGSAGGGSGSNEWSGTSAELPASRLPASACRPAGSSCSTSHRPRLSAAQTHPCSQRTKLPRRSCTVKTSPRRRVPT